MATTNTFRRFLAIAGTFALFAILGRAQGVYDSYWDDDDYFYGDLEGYDDDGGACNSGVDVWSYLDGYDSGTAFYPNDFDIYQSLANTNGGSYTWSWGFSFDYSDPYGGCAIYNISFSWPITFRQTQTYFASPKFQYPDGSGNCWYQLEACSEGTPTCPTSNNDFPFPLSFGCSGSCNACPYYASQQFWAVGVAGYISCTTGLYSPSIAGGPGMCT